MFRDQQIYGRVVEEMAVIQEEHAGREVQGVLIFGSIDLDPQAAPWSRIVSAYYLDDMLTELEHSCPDHPLIALFQPLIEKDNKRLQENASQYYNSDRGVCHRGAPQRKIDQRLHRLAVSAIHDTRNSGDRKNVTGQTPRPA